MLSVMAQDLVLCLGTSLVITPACDIPLLVLKKRKRKPSGGKLCILGDPKQSDRKAEGVTAIEKLAREITQRPDLPMWAVATLNGCHRSAMLLS